MRLDIEGGDLARRACIQRHIEREMSRRLATFARRIATVRIRLRERASSEATRILCGIGVTLEPRDEATAAWLIARAEDDDACESVSRAVERVAKAVGEEIARRDREDACRARAPLAFSQSGVVERV